MEPEPKEPRTLKVKRMFEPDRTSTINLQIAYEQILPTNTYRILLQKPPGESLEIEPKQKERTLA
jgi:hypothetical protein